MHLLSPVDDGERWLWVLVKATGYRVTKYREALCASKVHDDRESSDYYNKINDFRVNGYYGGIYVLNTYGK